MKFSSSGLKYLNRVGCHETMSTHLGSSGRESVVLTVKVTTVTAAVCVWCKVKVNEYYASGERVKFSYAVNNSEKCQTSF